MYFNNDHIEERITHKKKYKKLIGCKVTVQTRYLIL